MSLRVLLVLMLLLAACGPAGAAEDAGLGVFGEDAEEDFVSELAGGKGNDYDLLSGSHLSEIFHWPGVRQPRDKEGKDHPWRMGGVDGYPGRTFAWPVADKPVSTIIAVPAQGQYRIWLGYIGAVDAPRPVQLRLGGATEAQHTFGERGLSRDSGKAQEKARPIRFDSEMARMAAAVNATSPVWEYWDVELSAGPTTFELTAGSREVRLDSLFVTRSKDFAPSKDALHGNLNRSYCRFRVAEAEGGAKATRITERLTYHWYHIPKGYTQPLWYSSLGAWEPAHIKGPVTAPGGKPNVPVGEWTRWVDATEALVASGSFATERIEFASVKQGQAEVQFAWFTHPGSVLRTLRPQIAEGAAMFTIPVDGNSYRTDVAPPGDAAGVWGMRSEDYLNWLETPADIHKREMACVEDALAGLGAAAANPTPKRLRLYTQCNAFAPTADETAGGLSRLGLNWLEGIPEELCRKYGLTEGYFTGVGVGLYFAATPCPSDPQIERTSREKFAEQAARHDEGRPGGRQKVLVMKLGDEIGAVTGAAHINECSDCLGAFHDYLRGELKRMGQGPEFLGVEDVAQLRYLPALPENAGRYQRRLYYHSEGFKFDLTNRFYRKITDAAQEAYPNVRTYCNYTPGGPMYAGHMNDSPWFSLARAKAVTLAWGEDWVYGRTNIAGIQTAGYYAALVECAARKHKLPSGFYNVASCLYVDRKMLCLIAHDIFWQNIYNYGPLYAVVGAVDSWSQRPEVYKEVARGAHAVGPAETLIVDGRRRPRSVALLYNRTHEVWNGAEAGFHTDRLMTFLALQHAHVPVDVIIEEDITDEGIEGYKVIYVQGYNLPRSAVSVLRRWVERGGTLVGTAGTAMRDSYDEPMPEGAELFGATQRPAGCSAGDWWPLQIQKHQPIGKVRLNESDLTPAVELPVVGARTVLEPTSGKPLGTFDDGSCAAVGRQLGKGKTLLLGVMPGHLYAYTAQWQESTPHYRSDCREVIARPALSATGGPDVDYSDPLVEVCLFEHKDGLAVTLNDFSWAPGRDGTLTVRTDREITEAASTLRGKLKWERKGDRIIVSCPVPDPVDVIVLR